MPDLTLAQEVRFGSFVLDARKGTLSRDGSVIPLRPKAYTLLTYLARNIGRVVPKDELMDAVWPGIYVTEDSLTQAVREIRRELGDQEQVRTVARRGYMLAGQAPASEPTPNQPIVAVLRFRNEGGDQSREPVVDGFADDIITGLAHHGSITVLARNSTFQFASDDPSSWSEAARRVGADYLVEGTVRWSGASARVGVNLIDAKTLRQIWGDRYEAQDVEVFAVQREVSDQIINRLVSRLDEDSIRRSTARPTESLAAYELVTRAVAVLRGHDHVEPQKALPWLELAVEKDPNYGLAVAYLALCRFMIGRYGEASMPALQELLSLAARGANLAPESAVPARIMSIIRLYLREHAAAESHLATALGLNPCDADSVEQMGYLLAMRGRPLDALAWIDRAIKLNPIFPPWYHFDRALAYYGLGEYQLAADALKTPSRRPLWHDARLAACYAQLGDAERARQQVDKVYAAFPNYPFLWIAREQMPYERQQDIEHLAEGFTLALHYAKR